MSGMNIGAEVVVEGLTKSFGRSNVWSDLTFTIPAGEISALLGPSGTGKSVFLRCLIGLVKPDAGSIRLRDMDLVRMKAGRLREVCKHFGVLFQSGGLFGSSNLYDNVAYPLREHTRLGERAIRDIVEEKLEMVGLEGDGRKLPEELSGGMRKRAGLARALVMDPELVLLDEPDSGLDPVRIANLNQLIIDLNAATGATFLIVTHDLNTARTLPDNLGIIYQRHLATFGPRELVLTSEDPAVLQFLNGRREGPIGMTEEKDAGELAAERFAAESAGLSPVPAAEVMPQLTPTNGTVRAGQTRRLRRVREMRPELSTLA